MTPEQAQAIADALNSPIVTYVMTGAICITAGIAAFVLHKSQKTEADVEKIRANAEAQIEAANKRAKAAEDALWRKGVENFKLSCDAKITIDGLKLIIARNNKRIADLEYANKQLEQGKRYLDTLPERKNV